MWPCQVKKWKIILEQSLLTGWLASWLSELSTSFPISSSQAKPSRVEPWNDVEITFRHKWSDAQERFQFCTLTSGMHPLCRFCYSNNQKSIKTNHTRYWTQWPFCLVIVSIPEDVMDSRFIA